MFSFEGDYRKNPRQVQRGFGSVEAREQLLKRAAEDRRQREELRRKTECATKIQAVVRRFLLRSRMRSQWRQEIDADKSPLDVPRLLHRMRGINVFAPRNRAVLPDQEKSVFFLSQHALRLAEALVAASRADPVAALTLAKFIAAVLQRAAQLPEANSPHVGTVLRLVEIVTDERNFTGKPLEMICRVLIEREYFRHCVMIMGNRLAGTLVSASPRPPTEFHASLLRIMMRPLNVLLNADGVLAKSAVAAFCQHVLAGQPEPVVEGFVLRALAVPPENDAAGSGNQWGFSLPRFIQVLAGVVEEQGANPNGPHVHPTLWLSFALLIVISGWSPVLTVQRPAALLRVLELALMGKFSRDHHKDDPIHFTGSTASAADEDDSDEEMEMEKREMQLEAMSPLEKAVRREIDEIIELPGFVACIMACLAVDNMACVESAAGICIGLLMEETPEHMVISSLFFKFSFNAPFLRALWNLIRQYNLADMLRHLGNPGHFAACRSWVKMYAVFCRLLLLSLGTVYDDEFSRSRNNEIREITGKPVTSFEFSVDEVVEMASMARDVAAEMVFVAYSIGGVQWQAVDGEFAGLMARLFLALVGLIKELHDRDARRAFCPEGVWTSPRLSGLAERCRRANSSKMVVDVFQKANPFKQIRDVMVFQGASWEEIRLSLVLDQLPCLLPFQQRLHLLYLHLKSSKMAVRSELDFLRPDAMLTVKVHRDRIYEDAFEDLHSNVVTDMRKGIRVVFHNMAGLEEAGVDGGGLFREFMNQTLKAGFDANRAFFRANEEGDIYPNPDAAICHPRENIRDHFFFLGRLLGKAIFEGLLTELHFADFFLKKLLSKNSGNVDIHYLKSLDSTLFKNLLYLKQNAQGVGELHLDFTAAAGELGPQQVELKPNGRNIPVTEDAVTEYVFLMADFKLNKQIRVQTAAFRDGINDVVPIQLLQIFNFKELQTVISGTEEPIDVSDWRKNTYYASPYDDEHPTIQSFWRIVSSFSEPTKRRLLKFVTSCSRPPLLGFKDLPHKFSINPVNDSERLPTASTCMNLLKLPNIPDEKKLREKLLYAIESEAGFELS
ncbi:ubiquitin-protein ligase E3C-like [Paramacrobiotus metropolitanus]|uniref:ubiquitin-protein ligase E3C-like n=1 Tax=Paramacrobiotus metropolitanus TaxID=2943436 RepID=UPI002445A86C|nr:ubiquitin-protein ligase E3C-like [Paramacrobiotus metropolitanus]